MRFVSLVVSFVMLVFTGFMWLIIKNLGGDE